MSANSQNIKASDPDSILSHNERPVAVNLETLRIDRKDSGKAVTSGWLKYLLYTLITGFIIGLLLWFNWSSFGHEIFIKSNSASEIVVESAETNVVAMASASDTLSLDNRVLDTTGYVTARRIAEVSSRVTGIIKEILVEEGDYLEKDQIIARLHVNNAGTQLKQSKALLKAAFANYKEVQSQLNEAKLMLQRSQTLAMKNLVSLADVDRKQSKVALLTARLASKEAGISVAKYTVEKNKRDLRDLEIRAPFSGVVVEKNAHIGEVISPNGSGGSSNSKICTLVDMNSLEIEVDVNEIYLNRIQPSQKVEARLDAYPDWVIAAEVINIIPTADRQKATVKVRIRFAELDLRILPDMGVRVSFLNEDKTL